MIWIVADCAGIVRLKTTDERQARIYALTHGWIARGFAPGSIVSVRACPNCRAKLRNGRCPQC